MSTPSLIYLARQGANYVSDSVKQAASGTSKEANKEAAKDSDASIGTRASAAKDAVSDKASESKYDVCPVL